MCVGKTLSAPTYYYYTIIFCDMKLERARSDHTQRCFSLQLIFPSYPICALAQYSNRLPSKTRLTASLDRKPSSSLARTYRSPHSSLLAILQSTLKEQKISTRVIILNIKIEHQALKQTRQRSRRPPDSPQSCSRALPTSTSQAQSGHTC